MIKIKINVIRSKSYGLFNNNVGRITASEDGLKSFKEIFDDIFTKCLNKHRDRFFHKLRNTDVLCRVVDDKYKINRERFIPWDNADKLNRWNPPGKTYLYLSFTEEDREYSPDLKLSEYICLEEFRAKKGNRYYFCNFKPVEEGVILICHIMIYR